MRRHLFHGLVGPSLSIQTLGLEPVERLIRPPPKRQGEFPVVDDSGDCVDAEERGPGPLSDWIATSEGSGRLERLLPREYLEASSATVGARKIVANATCRPSCFSICAAS